MSSSTTKEKATTPVGSQVATTTGGALTTAQGRTTIADTVVSKMAGIAAREVSTVHALGAETSRAVGALREHIPGSSTNDGQGVLVEAGERQVAVDIELIAQYGVAIADLSAGVRDNVIDAVEQMTGLKVTEVDLSVNDVNIGDEGSADHGR